MLGWTCSSRASQTRLTTVSASYWSLVTAGVSCAYHPVSPGRLRSSSWYVQLLSFILQYSTTTLVSLLFCGSVFVTPNTTQWVTLTFELAFR